MSEHSAENGVPRTLYAVILAGLIEWAGEAADLEDCRSAARHITPAVCAHVTRDLSPGADPRPPKPEEPTGHLAVVEDSRGVRWVNWCDPRDNPASHERRWQSAEMDTDEWRDYVDIDVVEVLSEGVTS